jgi:hypothetical protein
VQLGQAIVAAGLHIGKTAAAPERLPRMLSCQFRPPQAPARQYRGQNHQAAVGRSRITA